jgi:hypothetical protein
MLLVARRMRRGEKVVDSSEVRAGLAIAEGRRASDSVTPEAFAGAPDRLLQSTASRHGFGTISLEHEVEL